MKILIITFGTRGDVIPYIAMGLALKNRGHSVTLISNEYFQTIVTRAGLDFIACGSREQFLNAFSHPDTAHAFKCLIVTGRHIILESLQPLYRLLAQFDPHQTLLISNLYAMGARLAQEKLGFPLISVCLQPCSIWSIEQPPRLAFFPYFAEFPWLLKNSCLKLTDWLIIYPIFSPILNQFRAELKLPRITKILSQWLPSPQLLLGLFPPWLAETASDWPRQLRLTGFMHYDETCEKELNNTVMDFIKGGEPPLVFTHGTSAMHAQYFFDESIKAAQQLNQRAILLTQYSHQIPTSLPNNILHVAYLPLKILLPHVRALIHHGGIGTATQAMHAGIPQLIIPFTYDQPDNAYWLERLGVCLTMPYKEYSATSCVILINQLLTSSTIQENCQRYARKINFERSMQKTCETIEEFMLSTIYKPDFA